MSEAMILFWKVVLYLLIGAGAITVISYIAVRIYYTQDEYRNIKRRLNPRLEIKKEKRNVLGSQIKDDRNTNNRHHY